LGWLQDYKSRATIARGRPGSKYPVYVTAVTLYPVDIKTLCPGNLISGSCINELLKVLRGQYDPQSTYAIFSTYVLTSAVSADDSLYMRIKYTGFDTRDKWIFPIHRSEPYLHWTMIVADIAKKELLHFDSLASREHWEEDVKVRPK
jgi:Ulp1 family protease